VSQLEYLREKLYMVIEAGNNEDILKISQELDKLILFNVRAQVYTNIKSA